MVLTMSETFRYPKEKTMALGGVATGSMKAKEALRVQGIMTYSGFMAMDWAWRGKKRNELANGTVSEIIGNFPEVLIKH